MKKVVRTVEETVVSVTTINQDSIVGFQVSNGTGSKGFLIRNPTTSPRWVVAAASQGFFTGNHYDAATGHGDKGTLTSSTKVVVDRMLDMNFSVYVFNTEKELFGWLSL